MRHNPIESSRTYIHCSEACCRKDIKVCESKECSATCAEYDTALSHIQSSESSTIVEDQDDSVANIPSIPDTLNNTSVEHTKHRKGLRKILLDHCNACKISQSDPGLDRTGR
jgi:hypothetical protein